MALVGILWPCRDCGPQDRAPGDNGKPPGARAIKIAAQMKREDFGSWWDGELEPEPGPLAVARVHPHPLSFRGREAGRLRNFSSRLFGSGGGTAEEKAREGSARLLPGLPSPHFPLSRPWLLASLGRGPGLALGSGGLERKEAREVAGGWGEVSALKVTLSCKLGQPGELIIGADKPGPVCTSCTSCSPPGGAGPQGEDARPEASHRVAAGRPECCAAQAGRQCPFHRPHPGQRAGREGGSPSPSWDVPASRRARDSPSLPARPGDVGGRVRSPEEGKN